MMDITNILALGIKANSLLFFRSFLIAAICIFLISGLLMWLWNITITRIFNVRPITYWEAFRLLIIASILFGTKISSI